MRVQLKRSAGWVVISAAIGMTDCHIDAPCEPSLPTGAHLQVRVLEVVRAAAGPECDRIMIAAGDEFGITIGDPYEGGADGKCLSSSAAGPPEFSTSLNIGSCSPAGLLGNECDVVRSDCDFPARLHVQLIGNDHIEVGASREMTYRVYLHHSLSSCPLISCFNEYRVQVTRLD